MRTNHPLYDAANAADNAWHDELVRCYGKAAGDKRYTAEGTATARLATLHAEFRRTMEAWLAHMAGKV